MDGYTRTKKSLFNGIVAVAVQVVSIVIGFFSRKLFLDYLGTEVLGLNTTAASLLNFLNLAELGISSAITVTLYKPLYSGDRESVRQIAAIHGWMYRRVALFIIGASIVLLPFLPLIFGRMELPMWYAYASFLVLLFSALLGYFVNYKQAVLTADQKDYKVQTSYRLIMVVKVLAQMAGVRYFDNPYVWWLAFEAVFAIIASIVLNVTIYREYPYLRERCVVDKPLRARYNDVMVKTGQLFVHRFGTFATLQALPLFIYAYTSLKTVALYGNYMILFNSLQALITVLLTSVTASVGNMITEGDKGLITKVFRELFASRFLMVAICCFGLWLLAEPFIGLWVGSEYILDHRTLVLIVILFFLNTMRTVVDVFINAYGIFKDIWSPIAEAVIFVSSALILAPRYGLNGILAAQILELVLVVYLWKPYFLFSTGMKIRFGIYVRLFFKSMAAGAVAFAIGYAASRFVLPGCPSDVMRLVAGISVVCLFAVVLFALQYATESGIRTFRERMVNVLKLPGKVR